MQQARLLKKVVFIYRVMPLLSIKIVPMVAHPIISPLANGCTASLIIRQLAVETEFFNGSNIPAAVLF